MKQTLISQWFDKALTLKEGQKLYIPCRNESDQGSKRVLLYRERAKYLSINPDIESLLGIFRETKEDKLFVVLEKRSMLNEGFIVNTDGSKEDTIITNERCEDLKRKISLMLEDNLELSEIIPLLPNYTLEEITLIYAQVIKHLKKEALCQEKE